MNRNLFSSSLVSQREEEHERERNECKKFKGREGNQREKLFEKESETGQT
jgi:hypothetical protein